MGLEDLEKDFFCMEVNSRDGFVINAYCFF